MKASKIDLEKLRFPIGNFIKPEVILAEDRKKWIETLVQFPDAINASTQKLSPQELNTIYRPNGWNIKQVVHHCADSHMNSFIRFKLALTEDNPVIKPYNETLWATLADGNTDEIAPSINIIYGVHQRWSILLKSLEDEDWKRNFYHPENKKNTSLEEALGIYAWHCKHHLAHIAQALQYKGIF